jgi:isoleucyl-tRNA synthetase
VLTRLLAPLVPFVTDTVWRALVTPTDPAAPDSVHLAAWPERRPELVDPGLSAQVTLVRRLVDLGRTARAESRLKIRQPLARALVNAAGWDELPAELRAEVADELNVAAIESIEQAVVVDVAVRPQFRALGRRFGARTQDVAQALRDDDPARVAAALRTTGEVTVSVAGEPVTVGPDEVELAETPRTGWHVATDGGLTVALDLEVTPALRRSGIARDLVRLIQQARKDLGLQVTDRITLWWQATGETADAMIEHQALITDEVLGTHAEPGAGPESSFSHHDDQLGIRFWIARSGPAGA